MKPIRVLPIAMALFAHPTPLPAASFDCGRAATPSEHAICSDSILSAQDDLVNAAYLAARRKAGNKAIKPIAREMLTQRNACGSDRQCIDAVQLKSLELYKEIAGGGASNAPQGVEKLYYGSRAGMQVTIVHKEGLDTSHALIRVEHTREDAEAYCRDYVGKVSEKCIQDELGVVLGTQITAMCDQGSFQTLGGERFIFAGKASRADMEQGWPELVIIDPKTKTRLESAMASGYSIAAGQFQALCPASVR